MKLLIAGSRHLYPSLTDIDEALAELAAEHRALIGPGAITMVVSGGAKGVDSVGEKWAHARLCSQTCPLRSWEETQRRTAAPTCEAVERYEADWRALGRRAGPLRNSIMARICDLAIVLWDGSSPGSADIAARLEVLGKPRIVKLWGSAAARAI